MPPKVEFVSPLFLILIEESDMIGLGIRIKNPDIKKGFLMLITSSCAPSSKFVAGRSIWANLTARGDWQ